MRSLAKFTFLLCAGLTACQSLKTRDQAAPHPRPQAPPGTVIVSTPVENPAAHPETPIVGEPTSPQVAVRIPKVGVILGPGGARAWAEIGVLQEMQREKIPVVAVGGVEWGALVAAFYADKGMANEAEWQMSKLKTDEIWRKSLMGGGGGPGDPRALNEYMKTAFGHARAEDAKLPFACPAFNMAKNQIFLMSRGSFDQLLPFCVPYPPLFRPWQSNVAAVREIRLLAENLRARGATTIVLVNVLGAPSGKSPAADDSAADTVLWNELEGFYNHPLTGVDHVLTVPLSGYGLTSFDDRHEILQKGSERSAPLVRQLAHLLGL